MEFFRGFMRAKTEPVETPSSSVPPLKATTFAKLSDDVYGREDAPSAPIDGFRPLGEQQLKDKGIAPDMLHTSSGMHAQVYGDDHGRIAVAFRGTVNPRVDVVTRDFDGPSGTDPEADMMGMLSGKEKSLRFSDVLQSGKDWLTNAKQGVGLESAQHNDAVALAKQVNGAFGAENVIMTGHSKGGGQAQLVSSLFGNHAVTFNSAGPHDDTLRRYGVDPERVREDAPKHITSVVTRGEILDSVQGSTVSFAPLVKATILSSRMDEFGDSSDLYQQVDPEKMKLTIPTALGKRVELDPDLTLGSIARHTMGKGVLPYTGQFEDLEVGQRKPEAVGMSLPMSSMFLRAPFGMTDPLSGFPLHGRFGDLRMQMAEPLLSDVRHPGNGLYTQALEHVEGQGVGGRDAQRLSGALVVEAQRNGLASIDAVVFNEDRSRVFAVQGEPGAPTSRLAAVSYDTAVATPLAVSSRVSAQLPVPQPEQAPGREQDNCRIM
jgi:hypothetical protein